MNTPKGLYYHPEHTWAHVDGEVATVGITDFAQDELGDIVYVEMPAVGATVTMGQVFGTVESSKSVSELFSPVDGLVEEINQGLEDDPQFINDDPYGKGWMLHVRLTKPLDTAVLLPADEYARRTEGG
jgi:glycine cleavage system H protein